MNSPREAGFHMPAEWAPHRSTWLAWPSHADLWLENLAPARAAFSELAMAIAAGEQVDLLVPDEESARIAREALPSERVVLHRVPFGDIWLRDTAPIFLSGPRGQVAPTTFRFNGWGGKYVLEHDDQVAERVAPLSGCARTFAMPFVLEGGAVDCDGEGTILTTRQCLLNPNRNRDLSARQIELALGDGLGCDKVLWLGDGLQNDHTDGHVDTLVRFVRPGVVVAMEARSSDDPNRAALDAILADLAGFTDARGRRLEVIRIPSPGRVTDESGRVLPASYVNFYISNASVIVPTYESPFDAEAVARMRELFPGRRTVAVSATAILSGGGAFHCITQQQPSGIPS